MQPMKCPRASFTPHSAEVFYRHEPFTLSFSALSRTIHYHLSCFPENAIDYTFSSRFDMVCRRSVGSDGHLLDAD